MTLAMALATSAVKKRKVCDLVLRGAGFGETQALSSRRWCLGVGVRSCSPARGCRKQQLRFKGC